jgi:hypothetical protein
MMIRGIASFLALAPALVAAQQVYELQSGSFIRDECDFCDRIPIQRSLEGTFVMTETPPIGVDVRTWAIADLALKSPEGDFAVQGEGSYQVSLKTRSGSLKVEVNGVPEIVLEGTADLEGAPPEPFIDLTFTEPGPIPHRDPNHVYTIRLRAAPKAEMVPYELVTDGIDGSIFIDDCLPCGRPTVPIPIGGTFLLGKVGENSLYSYYRMDGIQFGSALDSVFVLITGSGSYLLGGEVALVQEMNLELTVEETGLTTAGALLASGRVPVGAVFPEIVIDLQHRNPESDFHVFSLHLIARPADVKPVEFLRGDANGDGKVDISDAVRILDRLFAGGEGFDCNDAADTNHDGVIDISDAVSELTFLFLGGDLPPDPGPVTCGTGPPPSLGCESYTNC